MNLQTAQLRQSITYTRVSVTIMSVSVASVKLPDGITKLAKVILHAPASNNEEPTREGGVDAATATVNVDAADNAAASGASTNVPAMGDHSDDFRQVRVRHLHAFGFDDAQLTCGLDATRLQSIICALQSWLMNMYAQSMQTPRGGRDLIIDYAKTTTVTCEITGDLATTWASHDLSLLMYGVITTVKTPTSYKLCQIFDKSLYVNGQNYTKPSGNITVPSWLIPAVTKASVGANMRFTTSSHNLFIVDGELATAAPADNDTRRLTLTRPACVCTSLFLISSGSSSWRDSTSV